MNTIQKSLTLVLALLLSLTFTFAQGRAPRGGGPGNLTPEERAERQTDVMTERLGLTEEQVAKVKELNLAFAEKMQANREKAGEDRQAARDAMLATRDEHVEALKNVLTEEQFEKWENARGPRGPRATQDRGNRKSKRAKGRKGKRGGE